MPPYLSCVLLFLSEPLPIFRVFLRIFFEIFKFAVVLSLAYGIAICNFYLWDYILIQVRMLLPRPTPNIEYKQHQVALDAPQIAKSEASISYVMRIAEIKQELPKTLNIEVAEVQNKMIEISEYREAPSVIENVFNTRVIKSQATSLNIYAGECQVHSVQKIELSFPMRLQLKILLKRARKCLQKTLPQNNNFVEDAPSATSVDALIKNFNNLSELNKKKLLGINCEYNARLMAGSSRVSRSPRSNNSLTSKTSSQLTMEPCHQKECEEIIKNLNIKPNEEDN